MRTIKFRGIGKRTKTWIYGNLIQLGGAYIISPIFDKYETVPDHSTECALGFHEDEFDVIEPDSLGQFTGLLDKNGKEIFEGDIVAVYDGDDNKKGQGKVEFLEDWGVWYIGTTIDDGLFDVNYNSYIEVIGNIHDNPELLKNNDY